MKVDSPIKLDLQKKEVQILRTLMKTKQNALKSIFLGEKRMN